MTFSGAAPIAASASAATGPGAQAPRRPRAKGAPAEGVAHPWGVQVHAPAEGGEGPPRRHARRGAPAEGGQGPPKASPRGDAPPPKAAKARNPGFQTPAEGGPHRPRRPCVWPAPAYTQSGDLAESIYRGA